jgi:spore coat protein U-like protein
MKSIRLVTFALLALAGPAQAVNFNMTCTAASSSLVLNAYDVLGSFSSPPLTNPAAATTAPSGSITVTCTNTASSLDVTVYYSLSLSLSPARVLSNGTDTLTYGLYTDSTTTVRWGTSGTCTSTNNNVNNGEVICGSFLVPAKSSAQQTKTYYANVPGGSDVTTGTYTQTGLQVTLTYACNPAPTGGGTC